MLTAWIAALCVAAPVERVAILADGFLLDPSPMGRPFLDELAARLGSGSEIQAVGGVAMPLSRAGSNSVWTGDSLAKTVAFEPTRVLIALGNADAEPQAWLDGRDLLVPDVRRLVRQLSLSPSRPQIWIVLPPLRRGEADWMRNLREGVRPLLRQAARESGARVFDLDPVLQGHPEAFPDGRTPDEKGVALLAAEFGTLLLNTPEAKAAWRVASVASDEPSEGPAANAIDGDPATYWHTRYTSEAPRHPHELVIDFGRTIPLGGVRLTPRQDGGANGRIKGYQVFVSEDGRTWGKPTAEGNLPDSASPQDVRFTAAGRYLKLVSLSEQKNGAWTSLGELDVLSR